MALLAESVASYTHPGRRRTNQDAVLVRRLSSGAQVVAVADGMGGHAAGEVASALALEALLEELESGAGLAESFVAANARVHRDALELPEREGMGTTLVALLHQDGAYRVANIGDSRAYAVTAEGIRQLTVDHSYTAEALRNGVMTPEEAARSPWRNALTRTVGTDATTQPDVFGPFPTGEPHIVLLCSDGLYKAVADELMREFLLSIDGLETAVETLAALAFRRGSDDNISVAALEFGTLRRRAPTTTLPLPIRLQAEIRPAAAPPTPAAPVDRAPVRPATAPGRAAEPSTAPWPARTPPAGRATMATRESPRRRRRRERRRRRALRLISSVLGILALLVVVGLLVA